MTDFTLDPILAKDSIEITRLDLCHVRLMNDARYPWVILVPMRTGLVELIDLAPEDHQQLWQEITHVSRIMQTEFSAHKLNVAALGNMVRQLHIHIIARQPTDDAWPGPVWGVGEAVRYEQAEAQAQIARLRDAALKTT